MTPPAYTDLPEYWQEHIKHLRQDRAKLRRMEKLTDLPLGWQRTIKQLRSDCKTYRLHLRAAEQRIAKLEAGRNA
ncbi:hypothetical protein ACLBYD_23160 [Rhodococcus sp. C26F]